MTRKIYRTANGKMVDLGALQLQNETVRAVGNMGVNARGDLIDGQNKSIKSRNEQVAKQYKRQTNTNVSHAPVVSGKKQAPAVEPEKVTTPPAAKKPVTAATESAAAPNVTAQGGLAAAIAKARAISQEPLSPAPSRNSDGPVKI